MALAASGCCVALLPGKLNCTSLSRSKLMRMRVTPSHVRRLGTIVAQNAAPTISTAETTSIFRRLHRGLMSKETSAVEITKAYLNVLDSQEPTLQSFLHVARDRALAQAAAIDAIVAAGNDPGVLAAVPIAIKDNLCTMDMPSTAGSRILEGYQPPYDATAVARLRSAGAVLVGKTNMDEFGMGSTTEGSAYQATANPWDPSRVPGGSSGGSAAAVAAGQAAGALGSDTGGSVRQPASFCGVVGLKPTYGRVSRTGLMAYASSLDVVGVVAGGVEDAAIMLGAVAGHDAKDATSSRQAVPDFTAALRPARDLSSHPLRGVRLGLVAETLGPGVDPVVADAIRVAAQHLESLGAVVTEVSMPSFASGLPAYYVLASSEASSNLARYDGVRYGRRKDGAELNSMYTATRAEGFGAEVKRRILMGTYALSSGYYDAYYKRAQQVRTIIQRDFARVLADNDALLTPTAPTPAYHIGEKLEDPLAMYAGDLMTVNVNLAGLPAVAVPAALVPGGPRGLPVGLQMIGKAFGEVELLRLAHIFEQTNTTWTHRPSATILEQLVSAR